MSTSANEKPDKKAGKHTSTQRNVTKVPSLIVCLNQSAHFALNVIYFTFNTKKADMSKSKMALENRDFHPKAVMLTSMRHKWDATNLGTAS